MQSSIQTITVPLYGGKQGTATFRTPIDVDEVQKHCTDNHHVWVLTGHGDARRCKVNGKVRRWLRKPNRVEVPLKYGLYEYFTLTEDDIDRLLIPV